MFVSFEISLHVVHMTYDDQRRGIFNAIMSFAVEDGSLLAPHALMVLPKSSSLE